jgi:2-aminoadipate transaminase
MVRFAKRMDSIDPSAIREIFKLTGNPDLISFGGGSPANETFDKNAIKDIANEMLTLYPSAMLEEGSVEGWTPVIDAYIDHMAKPKGLVFERDEILVTTGSTQGISLSFDLFVNDGDAVLVESPTFLSPLNMLRKANARIVAVEMDEDGMIIDDLKAKLLSTGARVIYTIPTFQNPTGRTLSLERRKQLASLAAEYDAVVVEDDPYCDLRYFGDELPSVKSFDTTGKIILLHSFSKTISPGLRVGTVAADRAIIKEMAFAKRLSDDHSPILPQAICAEYLNRDLLPSHLTKVIPIYKERLATMLACIDRYFPEEVARTEPDGGLFILVTLPGQPDVNELLRVATQEYKVAFIPGAPFFANPDNGKNTIRLNFSGVTPEMIEEGMEKLGKVIRDFIE